MQQYRPARKNLTASFVAAGLGAFSVWCGLYWPLGFIPAGFFFLSAAGLGYLATRPTILIAETHFSVGSETARWTEVERIDSTVWTSPLVIKITLKDGTLIRVIYPGDVESASRLLRQVRRNARGALIDGVSYRDYWGDPVPAHNPPAALPSPRYRLLRSEDEKEVEALFQRLKSVGKIDSRTASDESAD